MENIKGGIYVLQLGDSKKYVGSTRCFTTELRHMINDNVVSSWVREHGFKAIHCLFPMDNEKDLLKEEETIMYDMMRKYGIENVRGGAFNNIDMTNEEVEVVMKIIGHRHDVCLKCGSSKHYAVDCEKSQTVGRKQGFWGWVQTGIEVVKETSDIYGARY